jgi:glycosyltransferase involved in cell wall biosynthesis
MKIGMLGWEYPPFKVGGLSIHCYELTTRLAKGCCSIDFYMPKTGLKVESPNEKIRIIEVPLSHDEINPYFRISAGSSLVDLELNDFFSAVETYNRAVIDYFIENSSDCDVIHCHDWITLGAAVELKRILKKPMVFTVHSTEYDRSAYFYPMQWVIEREKFGMENADRIIAVSKRTKRLIQKEYGIDGNKITVVPNGIDFSKFVREEDRDYERKNRVLFVGRVTRQKGLTFFVQMAKKVLEKEDCDFIVIGKGDELPGLIKQTIDLKIADRFSFLGFLPDEEVVEYMYNSDLYVLPSVSEPFGISVLEAMSSGLPVLISKSTGVGESLLHCLKSDFWDVNDMAEMTIEILRHRSLRETIGRSGKLETMDYTWERCAAETKKVYEREVNHG